MKFFGSACLFAIAASISLTGCGGSGSKDKVFREPTGNILPTADFTVTPVDGKAPLTGVTFDATRSNDADGFVSSYAWDFGDGGSGSGKVATYDYMTDGVFTATLVVTDDEGAQSVNTSSATITVNPNAAPVASFEFVPDTPQPTPSTITYDAGGSTDSDGTVDVFEWDFGDLQTGTGAVTSNTYVNPGITPMVFTVTLTVTDDSGATSDTSQDVTVLPTNQPPVASFIACPMDDACPNHVDPPFYATYTVEFLADGSSDDGTIDEYRWNFGDGEPTETSVDPTIDHPYAISGTFAVELTVVDEFGATDTISGNLRIDNQPPFAAFTADQTSGQAPLTIEFDAGNSQDSDGSIKRYDWEFGDGLAGTASTDQDGEIDPATVAGVGENGTGITAFHSYATVSSTLGARSVPAPDTTSIAIGDVNNDGAVDVVVGNVLAPNHLFLSVDPTAPLEASLSIDVSDELDVTLDVALADFNGDDFDDLVVANGIVDASGLPTGQVNKIYLWDSAAGDAGEFDAGADLSADLGASTSIAIGDVNGSGFLDVVIGNIGAENRLYPGNGVGGFGPGVNITADVADTSDIVLHDVDTDGDLDIIAANALSTNRLYLNDGAGVFGAGRAFDITADQFSSTSIALGDVDGDGHDDLVVANSGEGEPNFLYRNQCDVACAADTDVFAGVTAEAITDDEEITTSVALSDVDGDGDVDIMAGNVLSPTRLYVNHTSVAPFDDVLFNERVIKDPNCNPADEDCDCKFDAPTEVACIRESVPTGEFVLEGRTSDILIALLDNGTSPDLLAVGLGDENSVLLNSCVDGCDPADGNPFGGAAPYAFPPNNSWDLAIGDVDGDGDLDMVTARPDGPNRLLMSAGQRGFVLSRTIPLSTDGSSHDVELADMDGDGDLDLLVGNAGQVNKYYVNRCAPLCTPDSNVFADTNYMFSIGTDLANTSSLAVGDVDGDGDLDVVAGNGAFSDQVNRVFVNRCTEAGGAAGCVPDDNVFLPLNTDPTMTSRFFDISDDPLDAVDPVDLNNTQSVTLGDVDDDDDLDLVVGNEDQQNYLYINSCDGACVADDNPYVADGVAVEPGSELSTQAVALHDIDNDGDLDLVVGNVGTANQVLINNFDTGAFSFAPAENIGEESESTFAIAMAELNGDSDADVIAGNDGINRIYYIDPGVQLFSENPQGIAITADDGGTRAIKIVDVGDAGSDTHADVVVGNRDSSDMIYYNVGVHTVTLIVTDNAGDSSSVTLVITVEQPPP